MDFQNPVRLIALSAAFALAGCGGGSSSSGTGTGTGSLTLDITDAKVDSAREVNVVFTGIMLKPQDGERITFLCTDPAFDCDVDADSDGVIDTDVDGDGNGDYRVIDMLSLTGDASETLLDGVEVDAGRYERIHLLVNAKAPGSPNLPDSTIPGTEILLDDGTLEDLLVPGGRTGLKLVSGFTVPNGGAASFTIDFDLRKAITLSAIGHKLRSAFRLVDNSTSGHLVGEIANNFVQTTCPDLDDDGNGDASGGLAVYVFEGNDATTGDIGDADNAPLVTDRAEMNTDGNYDYEIGFLETGDYTAAVTCEGDSDTEVDEELTFVEAVNVSVSEGPVATEQNFD